MNEVVVAQMNGPKLFIGLGLFVGIGSIHIGARRDITGRASRIAYLPDGIHGGVIETQSVLRFGL